MATGGGVSLAALAPPGARYARPLASLRRRAAGVVTAAALPPRAAAAPLRGKKP